MLPRRIAWASLAGANPWSGVVSALRETGLTRYGVTMMTSSVSSR